MDEARLAEIERWNRCEGHDLGDGGTPYYCGPDIMEVAELIAEVRRLQHELEVALTERNIWKNATKHNDLRSGQR